MSTAVTLSRVGEWLARHAPRTHANLNPPATLTELDRAASAMRLRLLPDVSKLLLWHNGSPFEPARAVYLTPGFALLSADQIVSEWRDRSELIEQLAGPDGDRDWWTRQWVPIATSFTGAHLVVDHDLDTAGQVFIADSYEHVRRDHGWPNLATLLDELVHSLEAGSPLRGAHPTVTGDGTLQWRR